MSKEMERYKERENKKIIKEEKISILREKIEKQDLEIEKLRKVRNTEDRIEKATKKREDYREALREVETALKPIRKDLGRPVEEHYKILDKAFKRREELDILIPKLQIDIDKSDKKIAELRKKLGW